MAFEVERTEGGEGITLFVLKGDPSLRDWEDALRESASWLTDLERRGLRTSLIIDPSAMTVPNAKARRIFGEWRAAHMPLITNVCNRAAYVAESAVMRGVLVTIFWFARPVIPVEILPTRAAALDWTRSQMQKASTPA